MLFKKAIKKLLSHGFRLSDNKVRPNFIERENSVISGFNLLYQVFHYGIHRLACR